MEPVKCDNNFAKNKHSLFSSVWVYCWNWTETDFVLKCGRLTRQLKWRFPGCHITARWLRDQRLALPRVRTGLLIWLGGLAPCTLTALTINWYSVSGNNPFKTMELVSMGSRIYVHSVSISGLWNDKMQQILFRFCFLVCSHVFTCDIVCMCFFSSFSLNFFFYKNYSPNIFNMIALICYDMCLRGMFNLIVFLQLIHVPESVCKWLQRVHLRRTVNLNNSKSRKEKKKQQLFKQNKTTND